MGRLAVLVLGAMACGTSAAEAPAAREERLLTIVATSDLHGHVERVAALAGHLEVVRTARAADGGAVLLVDAGDMWQGTLESNLFEGRAVVRAYDHVGYDAVALGNHEFDYPRRALLARAREASFPVLSANVIEAATGRRPRWPEIVPSTIVEKAGIRIGIVGVTTIETPRTVLAADFAGLRIAPLAPAVIREARSLRARGATVVVVLAHAGGVCDDTDDPSDLDSCEQDREVMRLARAMPRGLVDAIVGGHTHQGVAHLVDGIPVVQSFAKGKAFGRIDLRIDGETGRALGARVHPPRWVCDDEDAPIAECEPGEYEGRKIEIDRRVLAAIEPQLAEARRVASRPLGTVAEKDVDMAFDAESPLGNLLVDLLLEARSMADVAVLDGSEIRTGIEEGPLTFGALYEVHPFERRVALVRTRGAILRRAAVDNLVEARPVAVFAGLRVDASCEQGRPVVRLARASGAAIEDDTPLTVVTSDFLATGGDLLLQDVPPEAITVERELVRDALAARLRERATIRGDDPAIAEPRVRLPGERPLRCPRE